MSKLSVCIIAKNEEANIARALKSVAGVADEMIVVDTGSSDNTVEIAKAAGARVVNHEWQHDFSEARNFALDLATNDWVLQLDADEELYEAQPAQLLRLLSEPGVDAYYCQLVSLTKPDSYKGAVNSRAIRLFRGQKYRYEGIIHEEPRPKDPKSVKPAQWAKLQIIHWGYVDPEMISAKSDRNVSLLEQALTVHPDDFMLHFYLGAELMNSQEYGDAATSFQRAESLRPAEATAHQAHIALKLCECLGFAERYDEGLKCGEQAVAAFPDYRDLVYILAELYLLSGRTDEALAYYQRCADMQTVPRRYLRARDNLDKLAQKKVREITS